MYSSSCNYDFFQKKPQLTELRVYASILDKVIINNSFIIILSVAVIFCIKRNTIRCIKKDDNLDELSSFPFDSSRDASNECIEF